MPSKLLDPVAVSRLSGLQLKAMNVVEGFLTGLHQSPFHGFSVEFAQHRPYMPGDSLKHLDYKVLAKTGRYYIKQYQEETNLKAYILLDHSGSMGYGSGSSDAPPPASPPTEGGSDEVLTKLEYGKSLAAAMALLLLKQRDAVGLVNFSDKLDAILPPKSAMGWLGTIVENLEKLEPSGKTEVAAALLDTAERVKRRGLVILISDLLDDPDKTIAGMKAVKHVGHELLVFHILDPLEKSFAFPRDARFKDMETGSILPSRPWHIRDEYRKEMASFIENYRSNCRRERIDYKQFTTDTPYEIALFEFLVRRKRMM